MNISLLAHRLGKFAADNSPAILTAIGVTGALATAYLTGRASFQAAEIIASEDLDRSMDEEAPPFETRDKIRLVWKLYIPAAGAAAITVASIICANRIDARRAASLIAAYSVAERAHKEYQEKVVEKFGESKEHAVRDAVAQERIDETPVDRSKVVVTGTGSVLCFDAYTGRYFLSSMEEIRKAENEINYDALHKSYATMTDFYNRIGLPGTIMTDDFGWDADNMLDVYVTTTLSLEDKPCLYMSFDATYIRDKVQGRSR